jgi:hypothetical protein
MSWIYVPHVCKKPLFGSFGMPVGAVWQCPGCTNRWVVSEDRRLVPQLSTWAMVYRARIETMADVGARELAEARRWLDRHVDGVYRDLGLVRPR